ncbi:MAG: T9SS type A sorting domain-containing protein [Flavobacteriales bacterium]|nr:T9SS type A sorting domain-containing protein [Flavobacteriales bacterium]MDG1780799.1 T9SS type A sorting domain-containing protein [Flavobacteriales bacterium]MDG2245696.1 T9SS type A sorting domain-containing protein [Flavobacteriales bacterium]
MKQIYFLACALVVSLGINAQTTHNVEAGGTPQGDVLPYFEPQFITIEVGDEVVWTNVEGFHGIATTSGPETFGTGNGNAPWEYSFTFTMEGTYDYECPVGSHADTQFGTITVVAPKSVGEITPKINWNVFPNPAAEFTTIEIGGFGHQGTVTLFDLTGALILTENIQSGSNRIDISEFSTGLYIVEVRFNEAVERRRLTIK